MAMPLPAPKSSRLPSLMLPETSVIFSRSLRSMPRTNVPTAPAGPEPSACPSMKGKANFTPFTAERRFVTSS